MSSSLRAPVARRPNGLASDPRGGPLSAMDGVPPLPSPSPTPSMDDVLARAVAGRGEGSGSSSVRRSTAPRLFLCIDGGGTKTGVSIVERVEGGRRSERVKLVARGTDRASNFSDRGLRAAVASIARATVRALEGLDGSWPEEVRSWTEEGYGQGQDGDGDRGGRAREPAPFEGVWAGLSGVNHANDVEVMHRALIDMLGWDMERDGRRLKVTNDCDLLASAIDIRLRAEGRPDDDGVDEHERGKGGVVLIAGTGSIAMAFKPDPRSGGELKGVGRAGGLGFLLGDQGSAYHIGRETLKAILDANDRGEFSPSSSAHSEVASSTLVPLVLRHYGVSSPSDLLGAVYALGGPKDLNEHDRKVRIAEVSRCTMACAYPSRTASLADSLPPRFAPDPLAKRVLDESAEELSDLVRHLAQRCGVRPEDGVLSLGGGTWGYEAFKATVLDRMKEVWAAEWKWVEVVRDADGTGAMSLALAAPDLEPS